MKKLLIIGSFVAAPLFSGSAMAVCQHADHYASGDQQDAKGQLLADEQDPELLARLKKQRELEEALEPAVTYN